MIDLFDVELVIDVIGVLFGSDIVGVVLCWVCGWFVEVVYANLVRRIMMILIMSVMCVCCCDWVCGWVFIWFFWL